MPSLSDLPAICSTDEAAKLIASLAPSFGITSTLPDTRTLRLWRTKNQVTVNGRRTTLRNLLEILAVLKLRQEGLTQQGAVERVLKLDEQRLRQLITTGEEAFVTRGDAEPLITLQLLSKGILEQYQRLSKGAIVGHTEARKTGIENTPLSLHQAMARLGRHYFSEGNEDRASSVHCLLVLCTNPLSDWAPHAIGAIEKYRDAVLIDPQYLVPNEDCEVIAEEAGGTNLSDLVEYHLHEELRGTLKKLGSSADMGYTLIREFIGRHPLAVENELQALYQNPELNNDAVAFVRSIYMPVHAEYAVGGILQRCENCSALIGTDNLCILGSCRDKNLPVRTSDVSLHEAFLARPEVLKYWVDPAQEELRLYDALRKNKIIADKALLYPYSDRCDVSVGEDVGVDVKDYRDPVRLAQRLNRSLGDFERYPDRILAIARRRWSTTYKERLIEQLSPERQAQLRVMSVDDAIAHLTDSFGGNQLAL